MQGQRRTTLQQLQKRPMTIIWINNEATVPLRQCQITRGYLAPFRTSLDPCGNILETADGSVVQKLIHW